MCVYIYIYIYISSSSLKLSHHPSLSSIVLSCILSPQYTLVYPCVGVHKRTSLMNSFLLLQQCPTSCLFYFNNLWDRWHVAIQLLFYGVLHPEFVQVSIQHFCVIHTFFFMCFVCVHVVHPYSSMDTATAWKNSRFILSDR